MHKFLTFALAIAVCLGTTAMLANSGRAARDRQSVNAETASDGAFRDGLYQGRLAAERGRPQRPLVGRWSKERDRASFAAGFQRGYSDFLASAASGEQNVPE